jgi:hypothetical protein
MRTSLFRAERSDVESVFLHRKSETVGCQATAAEGACWGWDDGFEKACGSLKGEIENIYLLLYRALGT